MNKQLIMVLALVGSVSTPYVAHAAYGDGIEYFYSTSRQSSVSTSKGVRYTKDDATPEVFIRKNYKVIKAETAKGEGDFLDTMVTSLLDNPDHEAPFKRRLKKYRTKYFPADKDKGVERILSRAEKYNAKD